MHHRHASLVIDLADVVINRKHGGIAFNVVIALLVTDGCLQHGTHRSLGLSRSGHRLRFFEVVETLGT